MYQKMEVVQYAKGLDLTGWITERERDRRKTQTHNNALMDFF